jgi:hypothetical protein
MSGQRLKLWTIDDVDVNGNLGLTVLPAKNEAEAREKFAKMHGGALSIVTIETCLGVSLAMVENERGATCYQRRKISAGATV